MMHLRRLEEAGLNCWPAQHSILRAGWVVRWGDGWTKRANAAAPLGRMPRTPAAAQHMLNMLEAHYAANARPCQLRLPVAPPPAFATALAARGYCPQEPTDVLARPIAGAAEAAPPAATDLSAWLAALSSLDAANGAIAAQRRALLERQALPMLPLLRYQAGQPVAAALGVLDGPLLGIFEVLVQPQARRQGHASWLLQHLQRWGRMHGARAAFLQVSQVNYAAQATYAQLGFTLRYTYHYYLAR